MKKIFLIAAIAMLTLQTINAQEPKKNTKKIDPQEMVEKRVKKLDKKLTLTDTQKSQIKGFYEEALKATPKERKAKMKEISSKIETVLTADQKTKFQALKKKSAQKANKKSK